MNWHLVHILVENGSWENLLRLGLKLRKLVLSRHGLLHDIVDWADHYYRPRSLFRFDFLNEVENIAGRHWLSWFLLVHLIFDCFCHFFD